MTTLSDEATLSPSADVSDSKNELPTVDETSNASSTSSTEPCLRCETCKNDYSDKSEFLIHLLQHVRQPYVLLQRIDDPRKRGSRRGPLRFTVRATNNCYKIVKKSSEAETSETVGKTAEEKLPRVPKLRILLPEQLEQLNGSDVRQGAERVCNGTRDMVELQTLPNESQSPSFAGRSPAQPDVSAETEPASYWSEPTEDPLRIAESGEKEAETHNSLLQNFLNEAVNHTPKDSLINSNETEYISLERLAGPRCPVCGERCLNQQSLEVHQKALGHYPSSLVPYGQLQSPLDSLANLPMQQLAQQVNRLQQGSVHQQNVLINIQQFGQSPHPPPYGREMPSPYATQPHYAQPQPAQHPQPPPTHMYGGYPPPHASHPMYYQHNAGMYPPMPPPHDRQLAYYTNQPMPHQYQPQQAPPPHSAPNMHPPRPPPPRMAPPPPPTGQIRARPRMPMQNQRPSAPVPRSAPTQPRMPRRPMPMNNHSNETQSQAKRKRFDVLIPDTNDSDDCHVISMQKCNDGWPIIKNVQGATPQQSENDPVVHLTDSITLSVRNPKDMPVVHQKKNDAKVVANILATRGITVTPAAKNQKKDSPESKQGRDSSPPIAINLNNAVSIIPTARGNAPHENPKSRTTTVDLTEDDPLHIPSPPPPKQPQGPQSANKRTLAHQCDLCPAQYPTLQSLMNHRRTYHKTGPQSELGVPVVDLRQTLVLNKLASVGIHSYIPLPQLGAGNSTFGLPVVSVNAARNPNLCNLSAIGSGAVLPLGPLRHVSNLQNYKQ